MARHDRNKAYVPQYGPESLPAELAADPNRRMSPLDGGTDQFPKQSAFDSDRYVGNNSDEVGRYARGNYGSGSMGAHTKAGKKRMSTGKRVLVVIGCILAALLIAAGAYFLWFSAALNKALAPADDDYAKLKDQLVSVPLDHPFYMLLLGSDSREGSGTSDRPEQSGDNQRSDVMILVRVDAPAKKFTLVTIPRDTPYTLDDGTIIKINETYNRGGAAETVKAVSELTGAKISHYAEVHVSELESIVDAVGGVDVYVDRELSVLDTLTGDLVEIHEGQQTLNGKEAQVFARARHEYEDTEEGQDYHRQSNVRTLATAIVDKVLAHPVNELPGVILNVAQYCTSDLQAADLVSLGMSFAGGGITMYSCCGPIDGDNIDPTVTDEEQQVWMCYRNPEGWAELMRQVDAGIEPGEIDYAATQIAW